MKEFEPWYQQQHPAQLKYFRECLDNKGILQGYRGFYIQVLITVLLRTSSSHLRQHANCRMSSPPARNPQAYETQDTPSRNPKP